MLYWKRLEQLNNILCAAHAVVDCYYDDPKADPENYESNLRENMRILQANLRLFEPKVPPRG